MENSYEFLCLILDSISEHIVVIDEAGNIQFVNKSWAAFGDNNACMIGHDWSGVNYLEECDKAASMGDNYGSNAGTGIRSVIQEREPAFYFEYPCHSPQEKRWFMMRVTPFQIRGKKYFVILHQNITERKIAEEEVKNLARIDGLTGIPNRRTFDEFLHEEWKRCMRLKKPISLAIVDIDHFKLLNDTYGHQTGDKCLVKVGALLRDFANRPGDICARYGGEEFALVWGDTSLEAAKNLSSQILRGLADLKIPNIQSPTGKYLTASIGLSEMIPTSESDETELIGKADHMLYTAKKNGRNKVEF
ncbi:MAG: diguanylate cyclase [Deltaproteobacteria bacterium RIFOXYC2_FULL_48_10]|nr:MAG: diguanylate cyclase [Deltaproteobacteria bacterium RIFOXYC2_FULL_48_10]